MPLSRFPLALIVVALAFTPIAHAAVLTVGPDGTYPTLQAAFDVADNNGEDDEIRIQTGQYHSDAFLEHTDSFSLDISGGWDAAFANRVEDASLTVLSGNHEDQVLQLEISAGTVQLQWVTLQDGTAKIGGGLDAEVSGAADFYLQNSVIRNNVATGSGSSMGGGAAFAVIGDHADLYLTRVMIWNNTAQADDAGAGGMFLYTEDGDATLFDVDIVANQVIGSSSARGGGLLVDNGSLTSEIRITRSRIRNNSVAAASASGAGAWLSLDGTSSQFKLLSSRVEGNADGSAVPSSHQLYLESDTSSVQFRDLAITGGVGAGGLDVLTESGAQLLLINATIAGNSGIGVRHQHDGSQTQAVYNSILFGNAGGNQQNSGAGPRNQQINLIGVDPQFLDPVNGNFRLSAASSNAINLGFNGPIGGLGQYDADYNPRVFGTTVDIGAFEYVPTEIHRDGFE